MKDPAWTQPTDGTMHVNGLHHRSLLTATFTGTLAPKSMSGVIPILSEYAHRACAQNQTPTEVSSLQPVGRTQPRMAVNVAQHKIINVLKTL